MGNEDIYLTWLKIIFKFQNRNATKIKKKWLKKKPSGKNANFFRGGGYCLREGGIPERPSAPDSFTSYFAAIPCSSAR